MTKAIRRVVRFALLAGVATAATAATAQTSDTQYHLRPQADGGVEVARAGGVSTYRPVFTVVRADSDPHLRLSGFSSTPGEVKSDAGPAHNTRIPANPENYPLPNWTRPDGSGVTDNVYQAGAVTQLRA
ncbi:MAG TPA: hypothetical protein VM662_16115, partial [Sphingomonas sp.]|nr:hypothetical protein [Sphingomonas sp.]